MMHLIGIKKIREFSGQLTVTVATHSKEVANNTNLNNIKYFTVNKGNNFGNLMVILAKIGCESNYNLRQLTESRVTCSVSFCQDLEKSV